MQPYTNMAIDKMNLAYNNITQTYEIFVDTTFGVDYQLYIFVNTWWSNQAPYTSIFTPKITINVRPNIPNHIFGEILTQIIDMAIEMPTINVTEPIVTVVDPCKQPADTFNSTRRLQQEDGDCQVSDEEIEALEACYGYYEEPANVTYEDSQSKEAAMRLRLEQKESVKSQICLGQAGFTKTSIGYVFPGAVGLIEGDGD